VSISEKIHYRRDAKRMMDYVEEDTIGVCVTLGATYTSHYEPLNDMSNLRPLSSSSTLRAVLTPRSCSTVRGSHGPQRPD
jgi:hypothetical protein